MRSVVPDYELVTPPSLAEALELMATGEGWRPMAGGTDLMVLFNAGKLPFRRLISVRHLAELRAIAVRDESVLLGSAVTYTQVRNHEVLQREFPMLCSAASWTGGIANQNRGTLGGNIANASPAADSAPVLLAHDAELQLSSVRGVRRVDYKTFHLGYKLCDLAPDEVITAIELPRARGSETHYVRKVGARKAQAIAKVCIAARARCDGETVKEVRVALGSVAATPLRCDKTEAVIAGQRLGAELIEAAQHALRAEISPISDIRSSEWYRTQVSVNLLSDFLRKLR